jgi:large subunit ribosomal protein L47
MWRLGSAQIRRVLPSVARTTTATTPTTTPATWRCLSFTSTNSHPLEAFRDPVDKQQRVGQTVGRSWSAKELRIKSFDDLHKLWLVLYKERNMLLTEEQLSRRKQLIFPQPARLQKVAKSMGAIRHVLGERKRGKIAAHRAAAAEALQGLPANERVEV